MYLYLSTVKREIKKYVKKRLEIYIFNNEKYKMAKISAKKDYVKPIADERDYKFGEGNINSSALTIRSAQKSYKITTNRIEDQGTRSACTSYVLTTCFENLVLQVTGDATFQASPMFNYTQSRILDSVDLSSDPGTSLRSAASNLRLAGIPRDVTWPYTFSNFSLVPSEKAYQEASLLARSITYFEVNRKRNVMKHILGDLNYMVMVGMALFPAFESTEVAKTGAVPMPTDEERASNYALSIGNHAISICGWDDDRQVYYFQNQYSKNWADGGYGTLPYAYFEAQDLVFEAKLLYPTDQIAANYERFQSFVTRQQGSRSSVPISKLAILIPIFIGMFILGTVFFIIGLLIDKLIIKKNERLPF